MSTELRPAEPAEPRPVDTAELPAPPPLRAATWVASAGRLPGDSDRSAVMVTRLPADCGGTDHYLLVAEPEGSEPWDSFPPPIAERLTDAIRAGGLADLIRPGGGYALRAVYYNRQPGEPTGENPNPPGRERRRSAGTRTPRR